MRALPLILCVAACVREKAEDSAVEDVMEALPDYGGCSWGYTIDADLDGNVDQSQTIDYDDQQRATHGQQVVADIVTIEVDVTYDDAGCKVASSTTIDYDQTTFPGYEGRVDSYTQTCDGYGNPVTQAGVNNGEPFEVTLTNTYDGDDLVQVDQEVDWTDLGEHASTSQGYTWEDGRLMNQLTSEEGVASYQESWTYDASGHVLTDTREDFRYPDLNWGKIWTYDSHGRAETYTQETSDDTPEYSSQTSWYDAIYHERVVRWHLGSSLETASIDAWDCDDDWPWSCTWTTDGFQYDDDDPPDGTTDVSGTEAWTCP